MDLIVDPSIRSKIVLGVVTADQLEVRQRHEDQQAGIAVLAERLRSRYAGVDILDIPGVRDVRSMYHALGMDPTKRRPSSEALLRRVLKGQPLPQVNTLVDAVNLCSLRFLLPIGLYDLDQVHGPVELRMGRAGEPYEAIGREQFTVEGRLVLADRLGPFGSPTSDSVRTMITLDTRRAMAALFAPPTLSREHLLAQLDTLGKEITRFNGGTVTGQWLLPGEHR